MLSLSDVEAALRNRTGQGSSCFLAWLSAVHNSGGGHFTIKVGVYSMSKLERALEGWVISRTPPEPMATLRGSSRGSSDPQKVVHIVASKTSSSTYDITVPACRHLWVFGSALRRIGDGSVPQSLARWPQSLQGISSKLVLDWLLSAMLGHAYDEHLGLGRAATHGGPPLTAPTCSFEDNFHERKLSGQICATLWDILSGRWAMAKKADKRSILAKWKTAISSNPTASASHLLLGAPDEQVLESFKKYVNTAPAPAVLRPVMLGSDGDVAILGERCSPEHMPELGLHGVFLDDDKNSTDAKLDAQVATVAKALCSANSMFPRIRASELSVQLYMLEAPDIARIDTLHVVDLLKQHNNHHQLVCLLGGKVLWVKMHHQQDPAETTSAPWTQMTPNEQYLGVLYCEADLTELMKQKLASAGQFTPLRLEGASETESAPMPASLDEFIEQQSADLELRLFRVLPEVAVVPLRRYGVLLSVQREPVTWPLIRSAEADDKGASSANVEDHPWQLGCWVTCSQNGAARRVSPLEMWVLAQLQDERVPPRNPYAGVEQLTVPSNMAERGLMQLRCWQHEHPTGILRCDLKALANLLQICHDSLQDAKSKSLALPRLQIVLCLSKCDVLDNSLGLLLHTDPACHWRALIDPNATFELIDVLCVPEARSGAAMGLLQDIPRPVVSHSEEDEVSVDLTDWLDRGVTNVDDDAWATMTRVPMLRSATDIVTTVQCALHNEHAVQTIALVRPDACQSCGSTTAMMKAAQELRFLSPANRTVWLKPEHLRPELTYTQLMGQSSPAACVVFAELDSVEISQVPAVLTWLRGLSAHSASVVLVTAHRNWATIPKGIEIDYAVTLGELSEQDFAKVVACWRASHRLVTDSEPLGDALAAMWSAAAETSSNDTPSIMRWRRHLLLPGVVVRRGEYAPVAEICRRARTALDEMYEWASSEARQWTEDASFKDFIRAIFFAGMLVPDQLWINCRDLQTVRNYENQFKSAGVQTWRDVSCLLSFREHGGTLQLRVVHKELAAEFLGITFSKERAAELMRPSEVYWLEEACNGIRQLKGSDMPAVRAGLVGVDEDGAARNHIRLWQQCAIEWLCRSISANSKAESAEELISKFQHLAFGVLPPADDHHVSKSRVLRLASRALLLYVPLAALKGAVARFPPTHEVLLSTGSCQVTRACAALNVAKAAVVAANVPDADDCTVAESYAALATACFVSCALAARDSQSDDAPVHAIDLRSLHDSHGPQEAGPLSWAEGQAAVVSCLTALQRYHRDDVAEYTRRRLATWLRRWGVHPGLRSLTARSQQDTAWLLDHGIDEAMLPTVPDADGAHEHGV